MFNEAKTSRPRPKLRGWGRGQSYEAEARTMRSRPRPKIIMKKYQIMINNIWFKTIAGKINKIPEFYTIFCTKNARLHYKTTRSRPGRDQNLEAEAKTLKLRPRPKFWPGGHFGLEAKILAWRPLWPRGQNLAWRPLWPRGHNITGTYVCVCVGVSASGRATQRMSKSASSTPFNICKHQIVFILIFCINQSIRCWQTTVSLLHILLSALDTSSVA